MGFTLTQNPIKLNSLNRPMWGLLAVKFEKTMKLNPSLCQILSLFSDLGGSVGLPKSAAVLLGHQEQRDLPAKIEELSPERTWPSVSDGSTPNFRITSI